MGFSYRDFFIGLGTGVVVTLLIIVSLFAALFYFGMKMGAGLPERVSALPAVEFPDPSRVTIYGQADANWAFRTLDGKPARLSEFHGKVVFLNFWATWCGPCVAEHPSIEKLRDTLKDDAVAFLLLSDEDEATVRDFVKQKGFSLPIYLSSRESPRVFRTSGIPATFILDPDGAVVYKHVGAGNWDDGSCVTFIRPFLQEKPLNKAPRKSSSLFRCPSSTSCNTFNSARYRRVNSIRSGSIGPPPADGTGHFYFAQRGHSHFAVTLS